MPPRKPRAQKVSGPAVWEARNFTSKTQETGVIQHVKRVNSVSKKTGKPIVRYFVIVKFDDGKMGSATVGAEMAKDIHENLKIKYVDSESKPKAAKKPRSKNGERKPRPKQSVETYVERYRERCNELIEDKVRCDALAIGRGMHYRSLVAAGKKPRVGALRSCDDLGASLAHRTQKKKNLTPEQAESAREGYVKKCKDARSKKSIGKYVVRA